MEVRRVIRDAHEGSILCVAYNSHRRELITGGQDGAIKIWDQDASKGPRVLAEGHLGWVTGLAYASQYRLLFSTSIDSLLLVWDMRSKSEWVQRCKTEGQCHCVEYDIRRALVYVGGDRVVRVYQVIRDHADEPTRRRDRPLIRKLTEIKSPHDDYVRGVVCSDSGRLFSAGYDSTLCVYEIAEANSVRPVGFAATTLRGCHAGAISTVAYEWENNLLLTGSFDRLAKLWSPEGKLLQTFGPFTDTLTGICYVPATRMIWLSTSSSTQIIFDPRTGTNVTAFHQPQTVKAIVKAAAAAAGGDGESKASAGAGRGGGGGGRWGEAAEPSDAHADADPEHASERLLRLFSIRASNEVVGATSGRHLIIWAYNATGAQSVLSGHADWVEAVSYMCKLEPDITDEPTVRLFSAGADGVVNVWEPASRLNSSLYAVIERGVGHDGAVLCAAFCEAANALVTGSEDATLRVWFQPTTRAAVAAVRARYAAVAAAAAAAEAALAGFSSRRSSPRLAARGEARDEGLGGGGALETAALPADADAAPDAAFDAAAAPADADAGAPAGAPAAAAADDSDDEAAAQARAEAELERASAAAAAEYVEATCVTLEGHTDRVTGVVALGPPAAPGTMVSVSWDLSIRWWRLLPGEGESAQLRCIEAAHDDFIHGVAYSPLTHQIATCSADRGVKIWAADTGALEATLHGHTADVVHVAWSSVHGVWLTGSDDNSIKVWSQLGRQLRHLQTDDAISALAVDLNFGHILAACNDATHALRVYVPGLAEPGASGDAAVEHEPYELQSHLGHTDCIRRIVHIPEKAQYLTASWDCTLRTWRQAAGMRQGSAAVGRAHFRPASAAGPARARTATPSGGGGGGGGAEGERAAPTFADLNPLRMPKSLQKESFGAYGMAGGAGSLTGGMIPRRNARKPSAALDDDWDIGQSGMALRLNDLLVDREAALEAELTAARAEVAPKGRRQRSDSTMVAAGANLARPAPRLN